MPFKFHEPRRHQVPKARYRVTNWPEYDRGLVGRGDLRLWIADDALAAWAAPRRRTRGGQARFSNLAIETVLVLASVFRLPPASDAASTTTRRAMPVIVRIA